MNCGKNKKEVTLLCIDISCVNIDHDRQWFNTLIPLSDETAAVTVDA